MDTKAIRTKVYLTQERFAKEIGVNVGTVRSWEQGKRNPSLTQQGKIVDFCKKHNIEI